MPPAHTFSPIMADILLIPAVLLIFAVILRQLLPAPKLSHQGEPLVCVSQGKVLGSERIYFGQSGLFVYRRRVLQAHYPFDALVSLEKTMLGINKQKVWEIVFASGGGQTRYTFIPLLRGFTQLYQHLLQTRPQTVKSRWHRYFPGV
ncbi:hypothetical protein [Kingella potus]|nr:hypothetical protein [Kingella potus]